MKFIKMCISKTKLQNIPIINMVGGRGVQPHFCPFCPDFDVSWGKMGTNVQKWGKKYMERERKNIRFSKLLILYYHYFRHINY